MDVVWIIQPMENLGMPETKPMRIGEDNKSCIERTKNPTNDYGMMHVDFKWHFTRDWWREEQSRSTLSTQTTTWLPCGQSHYRGMHSVGSEQSLGLRQCKGTTRNTLRTAGATFSL